MQILVRELGKTFELSLIDRATGDNWAVDFVRDAKIETRVYHSGYVTDLHTFIFWKNAVKRQQEIIDHLARLANHYRFSEGRILDLMGGLPDLDLCNWQSEALKEISKVRGKIAAEANKA